MFSVNHKLRFRIDLSRCASRVRFLRAPWRVWWSVIYGFHTTVLLNIRRKYSVCSCNTKAISCDSWWFTPEKSVFLTNQTLYSMKDFALPYSCFSYPMKLAERENFLISDHSSGARQVWYERGGNTLRHRQHFDEELLSDHRRISLRSHCRIFACLQTFAATFAEDFGTFAGEKWDVLWLMQSNESRRTSLVSYSFPLGE